MAAILALLLHLVIAAPSHPSHPTPSSTTSAAATRTPPATYPQRRGTDISWPNCPKGEGIPKRQSPGEPMPGHSARYVIVGVTNGPGFTHNPCLANQLAWVKRHHRLLGGYAITTYPHPRQLTRYRTAGPYDANTTNGGLRNAGYAQAAYNVREMHRLGMNVHRFWLDIEPYPSTSHWSNSHRGNRAVIRGAIREYTHAGYALGIYTYAYGWNQMMGAWRLPQYPTWNTVGSDGKAAALAMCHTGPSGGPAWLTQWYPKRQDFNLTCPAAPANPRLFK